MGCRGVWAALAAGLVVGGCATTVPDFDEVGIGTRGRGGSAHKTVFRDGAMKGGHLSGSPGGPPMVHQSEGRMPAAELAELAGLVAALPPPLTKEPECGESRRDVTVVRAGVSLVHKACGKEPFAAEEAEAVFALIDRHRVGGW